MALAVPIMPYTITQSFRGGTTGNVKFHYVRDFGDFFSIIDFSIKSKISNLILDGIIFQKITKITRVIHLKNKRECFLNTTKQILDYTSQNVKFMNEKYLEYFEVINGNVDGDQFQNSAITQYNKKNVDFKNVSDYGVILQKGECVFIPSNHPQYNTIKGYGWKRDKTHASNGLNYFDDTCNQLIKMNALWDLIKLNRQSDIVCHTVEYYWRKDPIDNECSTNIFVEKINKTEIEIQQYFANYNNIQKVKNIVDKKLNDQQKPKCKLKRCNSTNSRTKYDPPLKTKFIQPKPVTGKLGSRPSRKKFPGGGTIKSKKRRQTVKNRKKHNRKTVKRRKMT